MERSSPVSTVAPSSGSARSTTSPATSPGCWNPLQRSIVIGDELATIGLDQIKFSDRADLDAGDSVTWGDAEEYGCYWYMEG